MELDEAVRNLRLAQAALPRAQARADRIVADARQRIDEARADVAAAIVEAAEQGVRQRDIVTATGYTREWIRQIVRDGRSTSE